MTADDDKMSILEIQAAVFKTEIDPHVTRLRVDGHDNPCITKNLLAAQLFTVWEGGRMHLPFSRNEAHDLAGILLAYFSSELGWTMPGLPGEETFRFTADGLSDHGLSDAED
jgi:hypothetical protein